MHAYAERTDSKSPASYTEQGLNIKTAHAENVSDVSESELLPNKSAVRRMIFMIPDLMTDTENPVIPI